MSVIQPSRTNPANVTQRKSYSRPLRLWHWLNFIVISGSLITVLINSTITDDGTTSGIIKGELQKQGSTVTDNQLRPAVHALSDSVWAVHIYFGYALAALLAFRLVLEFFQLADQKFIRQLKSAYQKFQTVEAERQVGRHELTVKLIYGAFYLLLLIMALTGLFLAFEDALAAYKSMRHTIKEIHGFCMYLIIAFIVVHLAGVYLAERKDGKGIVSDMINGGTKQ
ncbi:cytochrome b/b6 domain-containing protein [Mucilaginibacter terrenus]|uniref:Cytochrome b/b6 domain-containing protein n=1 Tax=Mucilaginibacter terrenus TaxID=2482727 RepID=A0A3E2NK19_9SPHI|nr:cytochrome b/b6 domain-containing protein [Mucilaginibacter terrenus]RFZ81280.1 cytochrome b/b6 domain-containing protein [Mucilaginibacter terrenus]